MAGGKGERLRPLTNDRPKPMVLVNERPFLEYLIELAKDNGIEEVILLVGYKSEKIIEHFGDGSKFGIKIKYSTRPVEYNNGTRLREARDLLQEKFLMMYGDIYWPLDLKELTNFYDKMGTLGMMTVYNNKNNDGEYGKKQTIQLAPSGHITSYHGALTESPLYQGLDIGFYILDKKVIELSPQGDFEFQGGLITDKLIPTHQLAGFGTDIKYYTITNLNFLKQAEKFLKKQKLLQK